MIQAEGPDVELEVSEAHGFKELADTYRKMRAHSNTSFVAPANCAGSALPFQQDANLMSDCDGGGFMNADQTTSKVAASTIQPDVVLHREKIGAETAAFDLSEWLLIEPFEAAA